MRSHDWRGESSVVAAVVSWNTREALLRCLNSLHGQRCETWVVDNASSDGSPQAVRERAPWAHVVDAPRNLGFGRAVNLVAGRTSSEWLLVANADVSFEPGALEAMLAAGSDPNIGAVAPRLLLPDGATQHSVHPLPSLPLVLTFNLGLHRLSGRLSERLCLEGSWDPERPRDVPWAIGACLLLRRTAFDAVGWFDEQQWLFAEDLDLGWRLTEAGWRTRYEPRARVLHASGAATNLAFGEQRSTRFMAATYAMLSRRRGPARMWATALINIAGAAGRVAWMTPAAILSERWRTPRADSRRWLTTHVRGLRSSGALGRAP